MTRGRAPLSADDRAVYRSVGARVSAIRRQQGLTQDTLATLVGLTRTSITNIEAGRQGISLPLFLSLADALGVELGDLLGHMDGGP